MNWFNIKITKQSQALSPTIPDIEEEEEPDFSHLPSIQVVYNYLILKNQ